MAQTMEICDRKLVIPSDSIGRTTSRRSRKLPFCSRPMGSLANAGWACMFDMNTSSLPADSTKNTAAHAIRVCRCLSVRLP